MKKYIILFVAALASLCAAAGEPFYKNIYADFTMGFSRLCGTEYPDAGNISSKNSLIRMYHKDTRQYTLGVGYKVSPRWNVGLKFMFDSDGRNFDDYYMNNIKVVTTVYGEYSYLKWRRLGLTAIGSASIIDFQEHFQKNNLGEIGISLGAEFRIIRQLQLIVRYGFFGFGIGNRDFYNRYYWDQHFYSGCYSNDRSGLTADFGIRRLQFGVRVNL
ncbi:MAG: hypothetical protein K2I18_10500 [Paramuribaculum sp.]|nr:hypothetical protein [Paramuribaculum sp.]